MVPRSQAERDVDQAIAYYLEQRAVDAALGFIDALEKAYGHIGRHPAAGSPRYAHELSLPDLRFWLLPGCPYVVFYGVRRPCRCVARSARPARHPAVDGWVASRH